MEFFSCEKSECYDTLISAKGLLERADWKLQWLGARSQENQGGSMRGQSAWGSSESTAEVCYEPRRPKLIKLGSLNKSQMDQYLPGWIIFSFCSEASIGICFTVKELENSLIQRGNSRHARSVSQLNFNYTTQSIRLPSSLV